jgi:hypothetical protein
MVSRSRAELVGRGEILFQMDHRQFYLQFACWGNQSLTEFVAYSKLMAETRCTPKYLVFSTPSPYFSSTCCLCFPTLLSFRIQMYISLQKQSVEVELNRFSPSCGTLVD